MNILGKIKEWRRKRKWNAERQLYQLQVIMRTDNRWLAHNPIAEALTSRYLRMLSDHWESLEYEDITIFRQRIGLDPHPAPDDIDADDDTLDEEYYCQCDETPTEQELAWAKCSACGKQLI
jgi:hypothetical protein